MHTLLDLVGGLLFALVICMTLGQYADMYYAAIQSGGLKWGLATAASCLIFCFLYPSRERWSPTRSDTFLIMGIASGLSFGLSLKFHLRLESYGRLNEYANTYALILAMLKRCFVGLNLIFAARITSKKIAFSLIRSFFNLKCDTSNSDLKELMKQNFVLEIFYYYFCYFVISFTATFTCFVLFEYFRFV
jgi:sphingosine-1-phosphate phosphatase 1